MKTEIEIAKFKGSDVFTIWEIDDNGERKKFPLVSFGRRKGDAILKHLQELKEFCQHYGQEEVPFNPQDDYNHPSNKMHY